MDTVDVSISDKKCDDKSETLNMNNLKFDLNSSNDQTKEDNLTERIQSQADMNGTTNGPNNQLNNPLTNQLNSQLSNQINQINNSLNDLDKQNALNNNLSIGSNISTNINSNINLNVSANMQTASAASSTKNDFVIISVLKKQGVAKHDATTTTTKKVCFSDGIRPGDESIIEQQRTTLLPSLLTVNSLNANLMANLAATNLTATSLTATSQIASSRLSFKPFLAHSQLTYAQKGLLLNTPSTAQRSRSSKRHLSSSQRQQLTQQKLIQLSATSGTLRNAVRNTAATYTVLTKTGTKLNQTSSSKQPLIGGGGSTRSSNASRKQFVYLTNGKLLVNSYSNYNDMFQNEKLFTSYVLLA